MSTITVTNIKATGETASRSATSIAAAWANANGTSTIALRDSFNVSSITDEGVGDITHTFTSAMANTNYVQTCCAGFVNDDGMSRQAELTASWRTYFYDEGTRNAKDGSVNSSAVHGDLA